MITREVETIPDVRVLPHLQAVVELAQLVCVEQLPGVADVLDHGAGLVLGSGPGPRVHPVHGVEALDECVADVVHHLHRGVAGHLGEVSLDVHGAYQRRQGLGNLDPGVNNLSEWNDYGSKNRRFGQKITEKIEIFNAQNAYF